MLHGAKSVLISDSPVANFHPKRGLRQAGGLRNCQKPPLVIKEEEIGEPCLRLGSSVCVLRLCQGFLCWTCPVSRQAESRSLGWSSLLWPLFLLQRAEAASQPCCHLPGSRMPSPCPSPGAWVVLSSCQGVDLATAMIGKQRKPFSQGGEATITCQHPAPVFPLTLDKDFLPCCPPRSNSSSFAHPKSLQFLFFLLAK